MGLHRTNILLRSTAFAMLVLVLFSFLNKVVYQHSHILSDGTKVVHAHPYEKNGESPKDSHHHDLSTVSLFSVYSFIAPILFSIEGNIQRTFVKTSFDFLEEIETIFVKRNFKERAPPVYS